jgi:hypothetical protein
LDDERLQPQTIVSKTKTKRNNFMPVFEQM